MTFHCPIKATCRTNFGSVYQLILFWPQLASKRPHCFHLYPDDLTVLELCTLLESALSKMSDEHPKARSSSLSFGKGQTTNR